MFFCIGCVDLRFEIGCSISCELVSELARMFNNVVPSFLRSSVLHRILADISPFPPPPREKRKKEKNKRLKHTK